MAVTLKRFIFVFILNLQKCVMVSWDDVMKKAEEHQVPKYFYSSTCDQWKKKTKHGLWWGKLNINKVMNTAINK